MIKVIRAIRASRARREIQERGNADVERGQTTSVKPEEKQRRAWYQIYGRNKEKKKDADVELGYLKSNKASNRKR